MTRRADRVIVCVCALFFAGCGQQQQQPSQTSSPATIKIERLEPSFTVEAKGSETQPDEYGALAVLGSDIPAGSVILWNDQPLKTFGGGQQQWLTARVSPSLYANAGTAKITVRSPDGAITSNSLDFTIYPKTGPPPSVAELNPAGAVAGARFNPRPSGESVLGINGSGFLPGAKVVFGAKEMDAVFQRGTSISAVIPRALVANAADVKVWVVNPDGKTSNKVSFKIAKE